MVLGSGRITLPAGNITDSVDVDSDVEKEDPESYVLKDSQDSTVLEPWVEWVRRVTHEVEERCNKLNIESWVEKARGMKWSLAQRLASQSSDRWSRQLLQWDPEIHFPGLRRRAQRRQARPKLRWKEDIGKFLALQDLSDISATPENIWRQKREEFIKGSWRHCA